MEIKSQVLAASMAQSRNEVTLANMKNNVEQEKQIADLLQTAAASVPGSPVRGTNVNIKV
jgi:hypothetical protein